MLEIEKKQKQIKVSICCLAYNHEKYIAKCLEGFLMQKTDFPFEVLIHDDFSSDKTGDIIREYARKYPEIIKPILETKNQFCNLGISGIYREILYPMAKGKYITYCEGDDYWSSPEKLQKQVDILEEHPECKMCLHYTRVVDENENLSDWGYPLKRIGSGIYSGYDFMKGLTDGIFFHTTSFMCRKDYILKMIQSVPDFYLESDVDDVPLLLYMGQLGSVFYLDEELTCYRRNSIGSWTESQKGNIDRIVSHKWRMIRMYEKYNLFTNGKYEDLVNHWIDNERFMIAEHEHDFREMRKAKYKGFLKNRSMRFKVSVFLRSVFQTKNN